MKLRTRLVALAILLFASFTSHAQILVTNMTTAQALAQQLVGQGIVISNVTYTGDPLASGSFINQGGNALGLDSGLVLTTGRAQTAGTAIGVSGPPSNFASYAANTAGDAQVGALLNNLATFDAAVLQFDFIPQGDTVRFRYVFSSEEYPGFICSDFNDVFAFFISGPGITGSRNIALVPGTNIPVSINSVNGSTSPGSACTSMGSGSPFTQYYVNNTGTTLTHNGHTAVFTALSKVTPCQTYHLKIVIADGFDRIYDSGVFLEARSLSSPPLKITNGNPTSSGTPYVVEGCTNGLIRIASNTRQPVPQTINLAFAGTATNGVDFVPAIPNQIQIPANDSIVSVSLYPVADNIIEGPETLKILVSSGCVAAGTFSDSISIEVRDQVTATAIATPSVCSPNNGTIAVTVPANSGNGPYTYAVDAGTAQPGSTLSNLSPGIHTVTVRDVTGCTYNTNVTVPLTNNLTLTTPANTTICAGSSFTGTLTTNAATVSWSPSFGVSNPSSTAPTITVNQTTNYIVTAVLGNCTATKTFTVTTFQGATANAGPDKTIIAGDAVQLNGQASGATSIAWTPPAGLSATNVLNPTASPSATTTYTLTVTNGQGCVATDDVVITVLPDCIKPMEAFTPNGDGINDVWMITNGRCTQSANVQVFNRYGNMVYSNPNYNNSWDGSFEGKPLPDGTYYFVITYQYLTGKKVQLRGNVTILR